MLHVIDKNVGNAVYGGSNKRPYSFFEMLFAFSSFIKKQTNNQNSQESITQLLRVPRIQKT